MRWRAIILLLNSIKNIVVGAAVSKYRFFFLFCFWQKSSQREIDRVKDKRGKIYAPHTDDDNNNIYTTKNQIS